MTRRMLDTNTVRHLVRQHPGVMRRIAHMRMMDLCLSAVSEGELLFGLARRPEAHGLHAAMREFLKRVDVLPWDRSVAARYGSLRAEQERLGRPLGQLDMLIAAHALEMDAVLVTNDRAFGQVAGLRREDWTA